jgi:site-specific recombinase XerD
MTLKKGQVQQNPSTTTTTARRLSRPIVYKVTTGSLSKHTKISYESHINEFLELFKITDIEPLKEYSPKLLKQMIIDYIIYLRDVRKLPRGTIKVQLAAVSHFFYMIRDDDNRLNLDKAKMELPPDEHIRRDRPYTMEEIQAMLSSGCSRIREKVIILLLTSTGMRIGALHTLKIRDLVPKDTPKGKVYYITVYSSSSQFYQTPCNPECREAIDIYLKERTDAGETLSSESPLIRNLYNSLNVKRVKPLKENGMMYLVSRIVKLSGIKKAFQFKGEAKRALGFRKFYKTAAEESGMKSINVEVAHGHSIGMSDHYYRPKPSDILQDYISHAADALTVSFQYRLEKENQELKSERSEEIGRLKNQLRENNELVNKIAEEINALKTSSGGLVGYEYRKRSLEPNFSNIINALNKTRAKEGLEPVAVITPADKEGKKAGIRHAILKAKESIENKRRGIILTHEEDPFLEDDIETLETQITQVEEILKKDLD